jgi:hypothetical protein
MLLGVNYYLDSLLNSGMYEKPWNSDLIYMPEPAMPSNSLGVWNSQCAS